MNLFSYIEWRGDLPMSTVPLCPMDALILCRLAYCPMEGAVPTGFDGRVKLRDAAKAILESPQGRRFLLENDKQLLEELSELCTAGAVRLLPQHGCGGGKAVFRRNCISGGRAAFYSLSRHRCHPCWLERGFQYELLPRALSA